MTLRVNGEDHNDLDDAVLLDDVRAGDEEAFEHLWNRYAKAALVTARRAGADDPDDIVTEVYARVLKHLKDGQGPQKTFKPYLYRAVRNLVADEQRRHTETLSGDIDSPVAPELHTEAAALNNMDGDRIGVIMRKLGPRQTSILERYAGGVSPAEIAAADGISTHAATVAISRARVSFTRLWIQSYVRADRLTGEHKWVMQHAGEYLAGRLNAKSKQRVAAHLGACDNCAVAMDDTKAAAFTFGRGLVPGAVTAGGATLASATAWGAEAAGAAPVVVPWLVGGAAAVAAAVAGTLLTTGGPSPAPPPIVVVSSPVTSTASSVSPTADSPTPEETPVLAPATPETTAASQPKPSDNPPLTSPNSQPAALVPVTVGGVDLGPGGVCYPNLAGTAQPGATIQIGALGLPAVVVPVDAGGRWQTGPLTAWTAGTRTVNVTYQGGGEAGASVQVTVALPPSVSVAQASGSTEISLAGRAGERVEVLLDGTTWATVSLDGNGRASLDLGVLPAGAHTVAVRYNPGPCSGPAATAPVTQG